MSVIDPPSSQIPQPTVYLLRNRPKIRFILKIQGFVEWFDYQAVKRGVENLQRSCNVLYGHSLIERKKAQQKKFPYQNSWKNHHLLFYSPHFIQSD